ncbi:protein strawberry notch homolog 1 isoform X8 [Lepidochelys kempii]|uniref:protein strawberry notch homolog 1 isoform X8 n=1 Tax=Lepidochelys kempii TaxID=8472 RepID=UPI003C705FDE
MVPDSYLLGWASSFGRKIKDSGVGGKQESTAWRAGRQIPSREAEGVGLGGMRVCLGWGHSLGRNLPREAEKQREILIHLCKRSYQRKRPRNTALSQRDSSHSLPAGSVHSPSTSMATSAQYRQLINDYGPPSLGYTQGMQGTSSSQVPQSKYAELLAIIEELGKEIRPTYAGSKSAMERLKRGIIHARGLVRECLAETERNARS